MSLITISDLGKDYGTHTILDGISLRLARGEKVGILRLVRRLGVELVRVFFE